MPEENQKNIYTFDRVVRIVFVICGLCAALYVLNLLKGVLLPFLVAALIAYMLEPLVQFNMRILHTHRRVIPIILTLVETCLFFMLAGYILIPYIMSEFVYMADLLKRFASDQINLPYISDEIVRFIRHNIDFDYLASFLSREQWVSLIEKTLTQSWSVLSSGVSLLFSILSWLIVLLYLIFIMLDYERLVIGFRQMIPASYRRRTFRVLDDVKTAMNRYFRGQFFIASSVGVLFAIGFCFIDLPMGIVFGLFIGLLNMVPYLQLISLPMAVVLCLVGTVESGTGFWMLFGECMAIYIVVQIIQDLILTPKIMGKAMGLNPAIILLSLSVWGYLLGFMGMIIALPLTTLILSYYDRYVVNRPNKNNMVRLRGGSNESNIKDSVD